FMNIDLLSVLQIALGILLIILILLQSKGSGLGSTFGGEAALYRTKRGVEKSLFILSLMVSTLFIIATVIRIIV
ncbi:MAG: preprotein translocase subunit SecG, partial [Candidatus Daviesbacteria bacterium]|nr:preprotein translocase subunit SecG [Candidatus Daviesbacteria bacterium]